MCMSIILQRRRGRCERRDLTGVEVMYRRLADMLLDWGSSNGKGMGR